jgi:hypothetical protein
MPKPVARYVSKISVKWIILVAILCVTGLLAANTSWTFYQSWGAYRAAIDRREFDLATNRFIKGLYAVLLERLETNNALQASDPAAAPVIAKIEAFRKNVKDNFNTGLAAIKRRDLPNKSDILRRLENALRKANDYRQRADEAIRLPRARRNRVLVASYIPILTDSVDAAITVWYAAIYSTSNDDSDLKLLATIKEIGWRMREYSGLERSIVA